MRIVTTDHPIADVLHRVIVGRDLTPPHYYWQTLKLESHLSGPRQLFPARYITLPHCCLLDMKVRPDRWTLSDWMREERARESAIAAVWRKALQATDMVQWQTGGHLVVDQSAQMESEIGAVVLYQAAPVVLLYRVGRFTTPQRADVIAALCAAHLHGHGSAVLVYHRDPPLIFHVARNSRMYAAAIFKSRQLRQDWQMRHIPPCHHDCRSLDPAEDMP